MKKNGDTITAEAFDRKFDEGEDISGYLRWEEARRPGLETARVSVDFPSWMISEVDRRASLSGVTRQSLMEQWLREKIAAATSEAD